MVIVAGHLTVAPEQRQTYLDGCVSAIELARDTKGCLDFTIAADPVDSTRINIYERWESQEAVEGFRGSGPSDDQGTAIESAAVAEYDVVTSRWLT